MRERGGDATPGTPAGRHRFHLPPERWGAATPRLEGAERHHCADVLRLGPGEVVTVFDGVGGEARAEIVAVGRDAVALRLGAVRREPAPRCEIVLAQAVLKGSRMDLVLQKATELGADGIVPLMTERGVVRLDGEALEGRRAKWQQVALEAAKQCGRNRVPRVETPVDVATLIGGGCAGCDMRFVASLGAGARGLRAWLSGSGALPDRTLVVVGPEGDLTPAELGALEAAGCHPLDLGPRILRAETAAFYALSVLSYELRGGV